MLYVMTFDFGNLNELKDGSHKLDKLSEEFRRWES